jgi:hypothetical protein
MIKLLSLLCLLFLTVLPEVQAQGSGRVCTSCLRAAGRTQPVSQFRVPNSCGVPTLNARHTAFTSPANRCTFYDCAADAAQGQLGCNKQGNNYFHDYGRKYCNKFVDVTYANLSARGQRWMNETLVCLQDALKRGCALNRCNSCSALARWAFDSHPACYVGRDPISNRNDPNRTSICTLNPSDAYNISTTPTAEDLFTWNSGRQVAQVAGLCPGRILGEGLEVAQDGVAYVGNEAQRRWRSLVGAD